MSDTISLLVSGVYRTLPKPIWDKLLGPKPDEDFVNNGCTMSPDMVMGKPVWPACVIHDYHYNAPFKTSRDVADRIFRENIKIVLQAYGMNFLLARLLAFFYYRAVRRAGKPFYNNA